MRGSFRRTRAGVPFLIVIAITLSSPAHATGGLPPRPEARTAPRVSAAPTVARAITPTAGSIPQPADGSWREVGLLQIAGHFAMIDSTGDRLLAIGGTRTHGWALPLTGAPTWQPLPGTLANGFQRFDALSTWDPGTQRLYYLDRTPMGLQLQRYDPASGVSEPIEAGGDVPAVVAGTLVADPSRHRVLLVAAMDRWGTPVDSVWALDLQPTPTWSAWLPGGMTPNLANLPGTQLDFVRDRVLAPAVDGVWALSLGAASAWTLLQGSQANYQASQNGYVIDLETNRLVTVDGLGNVRWLSLLSDFNTWVAGLPQGPAPEPRIWESPALDRARHRLIFSGGYSSSGLDLFNDTWALTLDIPFQWQPIVPNLTRPPIRGAAMDELDPARGRLVMFGGADANGYPIQDTWTLSLAGEPAWSRVVTGDSIPPARFWGASAFDANHDRFVVFGGYGGDWTNPLGDLWVLSFAQPTPEWTPIVPAGTAPVGRDQASMVYDAVRDRFLLFFGERNGALLGDVWELRLGAAPAWRALTPTGTPPAPRGAQMAIVDPQGDRVLLLDGGNRDGILDELWSFDLSTADGAWTQFHPGPGPSARDDGLLRLDPLRKRLLLFGGYGVSHQEPGMTLVDYLGDCWALSLDGPLEWTLLSPGGESPPARDRASGTFDAAANRLVLTCGGISGSNDTWTLDFGGLPTPALLALESQDVTPECATLVWAGATPGAVTTAYRRAPAGAWAAIASLDADGEGRVRLEDRGVTPGVTFEYRLGVASATCETYFGAVTVHVPLAALALAAAPSTRGLAFAIRLPDASPAELSLFDVTGRRVWRRDVGALGAGAHVVSDADARLPSALYFARLTQGAKRSTARIVLAR